MYVRICNYVCSKGKFGKLYPPNSLVLTAVYVHIVLKKIKNILIFSLVVIFYLNILIYGVTFLIKSRFCLYYHKFGLISNLFSISLTLFI